MHRRQMILALAALCAAAVLYHCAGRFRGCTTGALTLIPDDRFCQGSRRVDVDLSEEPQPSAQKLVCLTFDDGPSATTADILARLKEAAVPATFFVMAADNNEKYLPLVAREQAEGHQVALHSCSHRYSQIYAGTAAYWLDIKNLRRRLAAYVDVDSIYWLRFPGGSTNTVSCRYGGSGLMTKLKSQAEEKGYHYIDWNVCAGDAEGGHPDVQEICRNVVRDAQQKNTCVVLMHDTAATRNTARALPKIIEWFKQQNYKFYTVEGMFEATNE